MLCHLEVLGCSSDRDTFESCRCYITSKDAMVFWTLVCLSACVLLLLFYLWRIKSSVGNRHRIELLGLEGIAQEAFVREGFVLIRGELWRARSEKGVIRKGDRVLVTGVGDGLSVHIVKKSLDGGL